MIIIEGTDEAAKQKMAQELFMAKPYLFVHDLKDMPLKDIKSFVLAKWSPSTLVLGYIYGKTDQPNGFFSADDLVIWLGDPDDCPKWMFDIPAEVLINPSVEEVLTHIDGGG